MANFNRDIVATRKLASKGRYGDNMVRKVDNQPSHVNAYEAYLIDRYGGKGEEIVKDIGAGTINPKTGMKEYHYVLKDILNTHHNRDIYGDKFVDYVFGEDEEYLPPDHEVETRVQAKEVVGTSLEGLVAKADKYLGPEGFLASAYEGKVDTLSQGYDEGLKGLSKLASKTGVSSSGELRQLKKDTTSEFLTGAQKIDTEFDKEKLDTMTGLSSEMNRLLMEYQSATGETYKGGESYGNLSSLFSDYFSAVSDDEDV